MVVDANGVCCLIWTCGHGALAGSETNGLPAGCGVVCKVLPRKPRAASTDSARRGRRGRWMQAEAEDSVWEVAPLAHGRTLAHLYGADAGPVRAELAVEAAPEGAAQPAQREDGSLADEIVTGDDLRPLHAAGADPGRAALRTQPGVCGQARAPLSAWGWNKVHRSALSAPLLSSDIVSAAAEVHGMSPVAPVVPWCVACMAQLASLVHAERLHKPLVLLPAQRGGLCFCIANVMMLDCSWTKAGLGSPAGGGGARGCAAAGGALVRGCGGGGGGGA